MISVLIFAGTAAFHIYLGRQVLRAACPGLLDRKEQWVLGFPSAVLLNALVYFLYTILSIPLTFITIYLCLGAVLCALEWVVRKRGAASVRTPSSFSIPRSRLVRVVMLLYVVSLVAKLFYGFTHATVLPSYYYDTISQWNMRAKVSMIEQKIAFEDTEQRQISKPQYPIALHALQISFMLPQAEWSDRSANTATLLLTLTSFGALFLLLQRQTQSSIALLSISLLFMIPLLSIHLAQGYGEIHVVSYFLLSALFLIRAVQERTKQNLLLSALFIASAAWIKQEGFFFGVMLWALCACVLLSVRSRKEVLPGLTTGLALGSLWNVFLIFKGLSISPHGSDDLALTFHSDAVPSVFRAFFVLGSFGVYWYALPIVLSLLVISVVRMIRRDGFQTTLDQIPALPILMWGVGAFILTLCVFLCTSNAQFLIDNQTFHRTMLLPLSLLLLGAILLYDQIHGTNRYGSGHDTATATSNADSTRADRV